jgi:hypothetical protein
MIIGINGKIGSGKDTIGSIIQYLTAEDTGQFCLGRIQSGKSIEGHHNSTFEIKKFAGKLKQIASLLTGIPVEMFEDQDFKQSYLGEQWAKTSVAPLSDATLFDTVDLNNLMTYREFLQKLGTEAMRDGLHTNVWVNALFADYHPTPNKSMDESFMEQFVTGRSEIHYALPNWIITDMRFPNEMDAVELRFGITIKVVRPGTSTGTHPSETALDDAKFDYEIINDGEIEDLIEKVKEILIKENII